VAFAIRATRVDIRLLAQNESTALGNPDLVIVLSMRGILVGAVECRAFAIHRFIAYIMTGHVLGIIPVPLTQHLTLRRGRSGPLAVVQNVIGTA